jgi:hypothetical protein
VNAVNEPLGYIKCGELVVEDLVDSEEGLCSVELVT